MLACVGKSVCFVTWNTGHSSPGLQQTTERCPRCAVSHFLLWVALNHCTVLVVTVSAAALSVAALLGADCVTAAVVAEGTPTQSGNRHIMIKMEEKNILKCRLL